MLRTTENLCLYAAMYLSKCNKDIRPREIITLKGVDGQLEM